VSRAVVAALNALQQLDLEIDRGVTELEAVKRTLSEDVTRAAREAAASARKAAERARRQAQDAEQAVHVAEGRIRQQEGRLYGGGTAVRDLGALETELVHLKMVHAKQEEDTLTLMLAADEAEEAAATAAQAYRVAEQDWRRRQRELQARAAQLEVVLTSLRARRQTQGLAAL
jgi:predicted  nucleic acid-binding Zn-ribbon protein